MKTRIFLAILLLGWLFPYLPSSAETLEIPLSVQASAEPWDSHPVNFDAGGSLTDITAVSLRLVGEGGGVPYLACMDYRYAFTVEGALRVEFLGEVPGPVVGSVEHSFGSGSRAPFEVVLGFDLQDFSFLAAGSGTLKFVEPAVMISGPNGHFCPMGNGCVLSEAALLVEYGDAVADEDTTWGALKATFR